MQEVDDNISGARRVMIQMYRRAMATRPRHAACQGSGGRKTGRTPESRDLVPDLWTIRDFDGFLTFHIHQVLALLNEFNDHCRCH